MKHFHNAGKKKYFATAFLFYAIVFASHAGFAQQKDSVYFSLSFADAATHTLRISMHVRAFNKDSITLKMPQWTPGYYQIMNYATHLSDFSAKDIKNEPLAWRKTNGYTWVVETKNIKDIFISYKIIANKAFVATSIADSLHAYLTPAATFLYVDKSIATPVSLQIEQNKNWNRVASGLDSVPNTMYQYTAPDFDFLYDCPILAGNLEELPSFTINEIPHRVIGYKLGQFDKIAFMSDIKRIVETSLGIMKELPYKHYTFLGIGPGNGGIEHLTSSANSFDGKEFNTPDGRKRLMSFLAHEYFHNYNVKRIRPIELGPFNYDSGSKTKQLWISEGWTVYYEYIILQRGGITADTDTYNNFRKNILTYEKHQGKNHQSLSQSSDETWSDGPFGSDPEKTISYYEKGPVIALLFDFAIRHYSKNKWSLDDVLRKLYNEFYKQKKRGFTEKEFRCICEEFAGRPLGELFDYVYTTKAPDYAKYLNYGGLTIDTSNNNFTIQPIENPDALQAAILKSWLGK
jgi:predicted metalloprotease with PDZ domain